MGIIYGYRPEVAVALTPDFRAGGPSPDLERYREQLDDPDGIDYEDVHVHMDLLQGLVAYVVADPRWNRTPILTEKEKNQLDGWLAPRLHAALRIPRRLASDRRFWAWVAIDIMNPLLVKRFTEANKPAVPEWRYTGILLRNGVSRLWWGAELVRNGPSYEDVPYVFRRTRTAQWVLELDYSRYRPAPIALVRVAEGIGRGTQLKDESEMRPLSKRINALLTLHSLEATGLSEVGEEYDTDWYRHRPELSEVIGEELPAGPKDGYATKEAIETLEAWFRRLANPDGSA